MPGGMVCTLCGRTNTVLSPGASGHAPWCPDRVATPSGRTGEWAVGYEDGFKACRDHVATEVLGLYRSRLGKLLATARQAFDGAARVDPQILLDAIERGAEREGLL